MAPRISVIACLNSFGELYMSLTQSNTNENVMEVYLHQLCNKLNKEKPGWRKDFVIFMDGAVSDIKVFFSINKYFFPIDLPPEQTHSTSYGDAVASNFTGGSARLQRQPNRTILLSSEADEPQREQTASRQKRFLKCRPDRSKSSQTA